MMAYQGNYIPQPMYGNSSGPVNAGHHQQFDPNAYPYPPSTTTAAAAAAPSYIQPGQGPSDAHAQRGPGQAQAQAQGQGQYHVPNQTYGGLPSLMPPPPHVPDDSHFRRAHLQHQHQHQQQRPGDRWPHTGMTEEQRYMQEQYMHNAQAHQPFVPPHFFNDQQQQQQQQQQQATPLPFPSAPTSSFSPHNYNPNPTSTSSMPTSSMTAQAPSPAPQPSPVSISTSEPLKPTTIQSPAHAVQPPLPSPPPPSPFETQRVTLLLEINRVLLFQVMDLQSTGKINIPGHPSPPSQPPDVAKPDTPNAITEKPQQTAQQAAAQTKAVNKEYLEYMRRLQSNLAYLASIADRVHKPWNPVPQFPAILEPPSLVEGEEGSEKTEKKSIRELYGKLKELWPDYKTKASGTVG